MIIGYRPERVGKKKRACCAQVALGDIAGESICSLDPAFVEKDAFACENIGVSVAGFRDGSAVGVLSPSSSSTMGGQ